VRGFLRDLHPQGDVPQRVCDALGAAAIALEGVATHPVPTKQQ
jgi:hypothetical protein